MKSGIHELWFKVREEIVSIDDKKEKILVRNIIRKVHNIGAE
jgi:hypothetical protein